MRKEIISENLKEDLWIKISLNNILITQSKKKRRKLRNSMTTILWFDEGRSKRILNKKQKKRFEIKLNYKRNYLNIRFDEDKFQKKCFSYKKNNFSLSNILTLSNYFYKSSLPNKLLKPTASYAFGIFNILMLGTPLRQTCLSEFNSEKFF